MQRFDPAYFTINFNKESAASLVATSANSLLVTIDFRTTQDLTGLYWWSTDNYSHTNYRYATNTDYSTTVLEFDFVLNNIRAIDALNGPTLAVQHVDTTTQFVRIWNYLTSGTNMAGPSKLDFANVKAGFTATDAVDWTTIDNMFLSLVHDTYDAINPMTPLVPEQHATFTMSNITVTGPTLAQNTTALAAHNFRMTDGYDDSYPLTPTRFVKQCQLLGYRKWYSVYMGISHHHDLIWNAGEGRFVVNPSGTYINTATIAWFRSLFTELVNNGFTCCNISVSFEIVNYLMPTGWQQYDAGGNPGLSGWSPPSEFVSPCNPAALTYLVNVVKAIYALFPIGLQKFFEMGEPWWWDNSFTTHQPCFYDAYTVAAYPAETGLPVPLPYITSTSQSMVGYENFLSWLGSKLGEATLWIRDQIKATYNDATSTILFYTPQIFATQMLQIVNLPLTQWKYPNWQVLQVEDYDWIIDADWASHETTWDTASKTLGYPLNQIHYFSGFNLMPGTAALIWPNVIIGLQDGVYHDVAENWVWARPEVFRDGITYQTINFFSLSNLSVVCQQPASAALPYEHKVKLRYSVNRGASWSEPILEDLGAEGEFATSIQFQRLGTARDRIFELSWSTPVM